MKEKKGKVIIITMVLIILALICLNGYLLYDKLNNKVNTGNNNLNGSNGNLNNNDTFLTVYEDGANYSNNNNSIKINVKSSDAKFITGKTKYGMILYYDEGIKLYDYEKVKEINIEYDDNLNYFILNNNFLVYYSNKEGTRKSGIYNIKNNSVIFKNVYDYYQVNIGDDEAFDLGYVIGYKRQNNDDEYLADVINSNTGKVIHSRDNVRPACGFMAVESLNEHITGSDDEEILLGIYNNADCGEDPGRTNYALYNKDGKLLADLDKEGSYHYTFDTYKKKIIIYKEDKVINYD